MSIYILSFPIFMQVNELICLPSWANVYSLIRLAAAEHPAAVRILVIFVYYSQVCQSTAPNFQNLTFLKDCRSTTHFTPKNEDHRFLTWKRKWAQYKGVVANLLFISSPLTFNENARDKSTLKPLVARYNTAVHTICGYSSREDSFITNQACWKLYQYCRTEITQVLHYERAQTAKSRVSFLQSVTGSGTRLLGIWKICAVTIQSIFLLHEQNIVWLKHR